MLLYEVKYKYFITEEVCHALHDDLPFVIILLAAIVAIVVFVKKRFGGKKN